MNETKAITMAGQILSLDNWTQTDIKRFANEARNHAQREKDSADKSERELAQEYLQGFQCGR